MRASGGRLFALVAGIGDTGGWDAGIFDHTASGGETGRKGKGAARDARNCTFIYPRDDYFNYAKGEKDAETVISPHLRQDKAQQGGERAPEAGDDRQQGAKADYRPIKKFLGIRRQ